MARYMRVHAPAKRTQKTRRYNKYYVRMCKEKGVNILPTDKQYALRMSRYLSWLYWQTNAKGAPITSGVANVCLGQLGAFWVENNISWQRKKHPQLALQLKWYKRYQPSDIYIRKPIMYPLLEKILQPLLYSKSLEKSTLAAAICIGHWFGGRAGEYTCSNYTLSEGDVMLCHKHLQWSFRQEKVVSLAITYEKSKVNQFGEKTEVVGVDCACAQGGLCAPCIIWHMCQLKAQERRRPAKPHHPVLYYRKSKTKSRALGRDPISKHLKTEVAKYGLNPREYSLHSLRIGRASDLARANMARWLIAKWGRWTSDAWEKTYARLNFLDMAKITNTSINTWMASNSN